MSQKKKRLILAGVLLALTGGVLWLQYRPTADLDPVYGQGKPDCARDEGLDDGE